MRAAKEVRFVGLILLLFVAASVGYAQGTCVVPTLKVPSVKGKVLSRQEGIPQATVELRDSSDETKTLARILTDDDGNFDIKDVKKGKYLLVVTRALFSSLQIPIRVDPKMKSKGKMFLIHLALDSKDPCSDGGPELK